MGKRGGSGPAARVASPDAWLDDYAAVSAWMGRYDMEALLDAAGGGIVRIPNFLPPAVAEHARAVVERLPAAAWRPTAAAPDRAANHIAHAFLSTKDAPALAPLQRALGLLARRGRAGELGLSTFSAGRYDGGGGHFIAPHDDKAHVPVLLDGGRAVTCSRTVALILYLVKGWARARGGLLLDLEAAEGRGRELVPAFNTLVAFRVPRLHAVTPVAAGAPPRLSLFGWFLEEGRRYELDVAEGRGGEEEEEEQEEEEEEEERPRAKRKRRGGGSGADAAAGCKLAARTRARLVERAAD